jgi:hypothetical protein
MSQPDINKPISDWLLKNYPTEAVFVDEINRTVNDIFQHAGFALNEGEPYNLSFQIIRRPETDYPEFTANNSAATLFMGAMAKAISDIIIGQILPSIQPETKKCSHCNTINNSVANYCYQCGNKFESGS